MTHGQAVIAFLVVGAVAWTLGEFLAVVFS